MPLNDEDKFQSALTSSFWKHIFDSTIVSFSEEKPNKADFLADLFQKLKNKEYFPSAPREYITMNKHNKVARIVPVFTPQDYCIYFYCVKVLEKEIAINRVPGTYGGWSLGNPIKEQEQKEQDEIRLSLPYRLIGTFNPAKWNDAWKDFQKKVWTYTAEAKQSLDNFVCLKYDIASFYDTINLNILEKELRSCCDRNHSDVIDLLLLFLRNWNKKIDGYSQKTTGLPQDEVGDCSRILANFYLQRYDDYMYNICKEADAKYLRYSDDQIIIAPSIDVAYDLLFEASKYLFRINLNINTSKVDIFEDQHSWSEYWCWEIFENLTNDCSTDKIENAYLNYSILKSTGMKFREDSVLRRIISLGINNLSSRSRTKIISTIFSDNFLIEQDYWLLNKLAQNLNQNEREDLYQNLDRHVEKIRFNSYHYNLMKFYKKYRPEYDRTHIEKRIALIAFK